jgi:hypothetical protein
MHCIRRMILSLALPALAAFPAAMFSFRRLGLVPESSIHGRDASYRDASQRENVPGFGTRYLRRRTGSLKSLKRIGCPGFAGVFGGSARKRR